MKGSKLIIAGVSLLLLLGMPALAQSNDELPPGAKPGECYARVFVPPAYATETERLLKQEASSRIEVTPARYEWAEERVLVKEASERIEAVPARYEWAEEKVLVKPAQTVWKKGSGPITKVDNATGEIMCLVEEPAVYKTVRKRVLASPASTRKVSVPAEYKTVRVQKLASPPKERVMEIPAEYQTITKSRMTREGRIEWKSVLCQTNLSGDVISRLQRSLSGAGFNPGPIDGQLGTKTMEAVRGFQKARGLAQGYLTMETLEALSVRVSG